MVPNKLQEENLARHKQLSDMLEMKNSIKTRIKHFEKKNIETKTKIKKRKEILDIKTGKLEYILEEKEALFNKLHLELAENKELKKKFDSYKKKKKKGFFSSFIGYFKKEDFENIDVSGGKVKKNILLDSKNLAADFENGDSYIDKNPDFNTIDFNKIRLDISENNILQDLDNLEIRVKERNLENEAENGNGAENGKEGENGEEGNNGREGKGFEGIKGEEDGESEEESEEGSEEESDDDKNDILDKLRKNLEAVGE